MTEESKRDDQHPEGRTPTPFNAWQDWLKALTPQGGTAEADPLESFPGALTKDPLTRTVGQLWQANPLTKVVPLDWAKVAEALRTVWLREMADPQRATRAATDAATRVAMANLDVWSAALARWSGEPVPEQPNLV